MEVMKLIKRAEKKTSMQTLLEVPSPHCTNQASLNALLDVLSSLLRIETEISASTSPKIVCFAGIRFASLLTDFGRTEPLVMASASETTLERHDADWFHFPYSAYPIQVDLMNAIYNAIDQGKIGLFESPTGTVRLSIAIYLDLLP